MSVEPWIGQRGLQREDLRAIMAAIRADPAAWLAEEARGPLQVWLYTPGETPRTGAAGTAPSWNRAEAPSA
jgi:hypothetical protein